MSLPDILPFRRPPGPPPAGAPSISLRALVDRYLAARSAELRVGGISAEHLGRLCAFLDDLAGGERGERGAAELRPHAVKDWLIGHETWKSSHQLETALRVVRSVMRWAVDEELLDRDPTRGLKRFWPPPQPRGACKPEEYRALMQAARGAYGSKGRGRNRHRSSSVRFRFQLWFLWETGCRTCELREALWEEVDWQRGVLTLDGKTTRATGQKRVILLSDRALRVLRWLFRKKLPEQLHVFTARCGRPLQCTSWDRLFRAYAELAGVRKDVTLYTLRHGFCVEALESGLADQEIAALMGHTSTRYISWYGRDLKNRTEHLRGQAGKVHRPRD